MMSMAVSIAAASEGSGGAVGVGLGASYENICQTRPLNCDHSKIIYTSLLFLCSQISYYSNLSVE